VECMRTEPFEILCRLFAAPQIESPLGLPNFCGGAVGYLSYDLVREFETLPSIAKDDLLLPHLQFGLYDIVTAVDHQTGLVQILFCPPMERFLGEPREKLYREGLDRMAEGEVRVRGRSSPLDTLHSLHQMAFHPDQTRDDYLQRVQRCQEYIAAGDIYQANLSHRFTLKPLSSYDEGTDRQLHEQELYRRLQAVNPSPFSGLLP